VMAPIETCIRPGDDGAPWRVIRLRSGT
jgi:hypothetical protein